MCFIFQGTREEWQKVFFICSGLSVFGFIIFTVFAKAEEQQWSKQSTGVVVKQVNGELEDKTVNDELEDKEVNDEHDADKQVNDEHEDKATLV